MADNVKKEDLIKMLKEFSVKLTELSMTIIASKEGTGITGEEKLREKLSMLYSSIVNFPGRPTDSQLQMITGLEDDFNKANITKDKIFTDYLEKINSQLTLSGLKKLELYSEEQFVIDRDKEKGI
jgi:UDP-N-acetylglucosamine enolpyruvyl transferase